MDLSKISPAWPDLEVLSAVRVGRVLAANGGRWLRASILVRPLVGAVVSVTLLHPMSLLAAQAPVSEPDGFDELFTTAQRQFDAGEFVQAARTWRRAANELPIGDADNRSALFDSIAEAYEKAAAADRSLLGEAVQALDDYAANFASSYPGVSLHESGVSIHQRLKTELGETTAPVPEVAPPEPTKTEEPPAPTLEPEKVPVGSPARPWKGLAIGGGVAMGVGVGMLGMFAGGYARAEAWEDAFVDLRCTREALDDTCGEIRERGLRADAIAVTGLVAAPLLVGAGVAMTVVAIRRKSARQAFAPLLAPTMAGLSWTRRF